MWDLIVSVPDHCLTFYFPSCRNETQDVAQVSRVFFYSHSQDIIKHTNYFQVNCIYIWSLTKLTISIRKQTEMPYGNAIVITIQKIHQHHSKTELGFGLKVASFRF